MLEIQPSRAHKSKSKRGWKNPYKFNLIIRKKGRSTRCLRLDEWLIAESQLHQFGDKNDEASDINEAGSLFLSTY